MWMDVVGSVSFCIWRKWCEQGLGVVCEALLKQEAPVSRASPLCGVLALLDNYMLCYGVVWALVELWGLQHIGCGWIRADMLLYFAVVYSRYFQHCNGGNARPAKPAKVKQKKALGCHRKNTVLKDTGMRTCVSSNFLVPLHNMYMYAYHMHCLCVCVSPFGLC